MKLPETARPEDVACLHCRSRVSTLAIRAIDGTALWFRCEVCGFGWNAAYQLSLLETLCQNS